MTTIIRTSAELQMLKKFKARRGIDRLVLEMAGNPYDLSRGEQVINRSLHACGCETAAIFLVTGLAATGVLAWLHPAYYDLSSPQGVFQVLGFLVLLVLTGKIVGLAIAEWRLRAAIDRIVTGAGPNRTGASTDVVTCISANDSRQQDRCGNQLQMTSVDAFASGETHDLGAVLGQ